jgi:F-type H+-transporting ATPase subunit b
MGEVFVQRLRAMTGSDKEQLAAAFKTATQPARVRSAFDLPPAQRNAIASAVKETFAVETQVQFETVPELVVGIEFSANGQKVAWSIADYLSTLEKSAGELILEDAKPVAKSKLEAEAKAKPDPKVVAKPVLAASAPKADH